MLLFAVALFAAPAIAEPIGDMPIVIPTSEHALCPETPMSLARKMGKRGPKAIPLTQLPPAQTFMAVDRRIDGCEAPLTMSSYRNLRQR